MSTSVRRPSGFAEGRWLGQSRGERSSTDRGKDAAMPLTRPGTAPAREPVMSAAIRAGTAPSLEAEEKACYRSCGKVDFLSVPRGVVAAGLTRRMWQTIETYMLAIPEYRGPP